MPASPSFSSISTAAAFLAVAAQTDAFTPTPTTSSSSASSFLHLQRPVGGCHFQLDELEDAETWSTDVLLNADMTVTLGRTDGPLYTSAHGTWEDHAQSLVDEQSGDKRMFKMKLTRTFKSGVERRDKLSHIGEFEYTVERTYAGECYLVAGSVFAMSGEILDVDDIFGERKLGFFNMIDTTEEREANSII